MPLQGWTNTNWDTAATGGIYRPSVEKAHEDQLARLRDEEPTIEPGAHASFASIVTAVVFLVVVASIIFFPQMLAAIFS